MQGIIADVVNGNPSKIISQYVTTPLTWGIHTGINNSLQHYADIYERQYAISRFGSGSHLMAIVDANSKGHTLQKQQFTVIKNLDGALESLKNHGTDVFYWEKFTTKPYVDSGQLKRVGEFVTPWPCFVIAATDKILDNNTDKIKQMLNVIHQSCDDFMRNENAVELVSQRYHQKVEDVARWYHSTEWATHGWVSNKMIKSVLFNIKTANIIEANQVIPELIWRRN